jgi:LmbE family N-acetylglucosaminyl deacetylase
MDLTAPVHSAQSEVASLGTILGVWAHPDDEVFLSAGLMMVARRAGNRVVCVTATLGELGTDDPGRWPPSRLGAVRAREQLAALRVLGVDDVIVLGYEDGTCADVDVREATDRLVDIIDAIRPDTVVTFGRDGLTGHPDHAAVSGWAACALRRSGSTARLLQATVTPEARLRQRPTNDALGAFGPGLPATTPRARLAVRLELDDELLDRKLGALRAHASQTRPQEELVGTRAYRAWQQEEAFVAVDAVCADGAGRYGVGTAEDDDRMLPLSG